MTVPRRGTTAENMAKAMKQIFYDKGMPISSPDEGDLDDMERERWNALVEAATAALVSIWEPTEQMRLAAFKQSRAGSPYFAQMWRAAILEATKS